MEVPACPSWTGKALRELTAAEIGELLTLLEERDGDELICRVLARELADRTAAADHSMAWVFE
ncbi:hypothetical protein [Spirillospora sp. NPDC029432]|uniref:hypothetical protein n=1 Tax=Spirillospora sp. NPDC029432 TaxID=3154599 RepID=UPI003456C507